MDEIQWRAVYQCWSGPHMGEVACNNGQWSWLVCFDAVGGPSEEWCGDARTLEAAKAKVAEAFRRYEMGE